MSATVVATLRTRTTFISATELAALLNVTRMSVHLWAKDGTLPHYRVNTRLRFDPAEVAEWLERRRVGNAA
jgi:excisionase family DNA binding protein